MRRALTYRLFEALEVSENTTDGLSEFIQEIDAKFPNNTKLLEDLSKFIIKSKCPSIKFDTIYGAMGISKTDECIISKSALSRDLGNLLYVILHEVAHQYQYKKYGKDVMWDAYNSTIDLDTATDLLMNIELVADRLAYLKANAILKDNNIQTKVPIRTVYSKISRDYFKSHLESLRDEVKKKGFTSADDVNEWMYNKLKTKPPVTQWSRPSYSSRQRTSNSTDFQNQSRIDQILDKLSADGWENLTEPEKNTLRAASKKTEAPKTTDSSQLDLF